MHAARLGDGRLHLQHGPIDLIIGADGGADGARAPAFAAASARFDGLLQGLATDLPSHRAPLRNDTPVPSDPVAQRMYGAARPFCAAHFLTPMIAVAGSVSDEILQAMLSAGPLTRAYVNNGGDIAVHLAQGATFSIAMARHDGADLGRLRFGAADGIGGIATSGRHGRSLSLGIADSVTVVARNAAAADVAATLIANAVDLPGHPAVTRTPASDLAPDSDLGNRPVVTALAPLAPDDCTRALRSGTDRAKAMIAAGHILGAALFLQDQSALLGHSFTRTKEISHA